MFTATHIVELGNLLELVGRKGWIWRKFLCSKKDMQTQQAQKGFTFPEKSGIAGLQILLEPWGMKEECIAYPYRSFWSYAKCSKGFTISEKSGIAGLLILLYECNTEHPPPNCMMEGGDW